MLSELILKAAANKDWKTVYVFLDAQVDISNAQQPGKTIVNINACDSHNMTLLDHAIAQENIEAFIILCSQNAKTSAALNDIPVIHPQPVRARFNPYYKAMQTIAPPLKFKPLLDNSENKNMSPLAL